MGLYGHFKNAPQNDLWPTKVNSLNLAAEEIASKWKQWRLIVKSIETWREVADDTVSDDASICSS